MATCYRKSFASCILLIKLSQTLVSVINVYHAPYYKNNRVVFMIIGANFTPDTRARVNNVVTDLTPPPPHTHTYQLILECLHNYLEYTFIFEEMLFCSYLRNYSSFMCSVTSYKSINPHTSSLTMN